MFARKNNPVLNNKVIATFGVFYSARDTTQLKGGRFRTTSFFFLYAPHITRNKDFFHPNIHILKSFRLLIRDKRHQYIDHLKT